VSKAKPKTPAASKTRATKNASGRAITVRMYRQGLGDSFLISFPRASGKPFFMLIDCGVILGTPNQVEIMRKVVSDITATTGGEIDLLVATHEHWDHLSAFVQAQDLFQKPVFKVHAVWLAWTEDPENKLAAKLRKGRSMALAALRKTALRLGASNPDRAGGLTSVLEFFGDVGNGGQLAAASVTRRNGTTTDALRFINALVDRPGYRRPGEAPIKLPQVDGVRIYILGPPEDEKLIKKSDPTKAGREVYELTLDSEFENAFLAAAQFSDLPDDQLTGDQRRQRELSLPFDDRNAISTERAKLLPFFQQRYGFDQADETLSWRHIEEDWLEASGSLALKLDSDTNNTSLAMAIEFEAPGGEAQVLLFPGDAQVGNWLSWEDLRWPKEATDNADLLTCRQLLERTVFYKVGHHASHNATLREKGLELMTHPDLVAMIPVDEKMAREKKKWNMPFPGLFKRLQEKTRGRIVRADESLATLKQRLTPESGDKTQMSSFLDRLRADPNDLLFIEYQIPMNG